MARSIGGRVTDAVIRDLSYIGYLVEAKAPDGPYFEASPSPLAVATVSQRTTPEPASGSQRARG